MEDSNHNNKWVINLSKTSLTEAQKAVLAKGPNYAITPSNIPSIDYITAIESMCPKLKEDEAMELRSDINLLLTKAKEPKPNLTKQEKNRIIPAQKGQGQGYLNSRERCSYGHYWQGGL